jgi:hypothetical protein
VIFRFAAVRTALTKEAGAATEFAAEASVSEPNTSRLHQLRGRGLMGVLSH